MALGLALLWTTSIIWVSLAVLTEKWLWLLALLAYGLITGAAGIAFYRSTHSYQCADCHLRWTI